MSERLDDPTIPLTHQFIANGYSGVTSALHILESEHAIQNTRSPAIFTYREERKHFSMRLPSPNNAPEPPMACVRADAIIEVPTISVRMLSVRRVQAQRREQDSGTSYAPEPYVQTCNRSKAQLLHVLISLPPASHVSSASVISSGSSDGLRAHLCRTAAALLIGISIRANFPLYTMNSRLVSCWSGRSLRNKST